MKAKTTYKKKSYKSKRTTKAVVPKAIKQYVKKALDDDMEDKLGVLQSALSTAISQTATNAIGVIQNILPLVNQGPEVCDRLGNKIKCRKLIYTGLVSRINANASATPQITMLVICRLKASFDPPSLSDMNLIKYQSSATGGIVNSGIYSTDFRTVVSPFNTDYFDIKYVKMFKVWNASGTPTPLVNNDFSIAKPFKIDCTKWVKKNWHYNNNTNNPENEGLYACWFAINIDSSTTFLNCVSVDTVSYLYYDDA